MRLIFIRHAEPDYPNNSLTEKGFREAQLLSERVCRWDVDRFYTSPLARAVLTAEPSMKRLAREAIPAEWLKEFSYMITDPTTGRVHVPWDFMPSWWTNQSQLLDPDSWYLHPLFRTSEGYAQAVRDLRSGLDAILAEYGYMRSGRMYLRDDKITESDDNLTIVFFGHLGANMEAIGYLLSISPIVLQQSFFLPTTSVSILNAEKRMPGEAMFRAQVIGDASHLTSRGEPLSRMGAFSDVSDL